MGIPVTTATFPLLETELVHICEGCKLTHCKFTTRLLTSIQKCVALCMLSSYPSCKHTFDSEVLCCP